MYEDAMEAGRRPGTQGDRFLTPTKETNGIDFPGTPTPEAGRKAAAKALAIPNPNPIPGVPSRDEPANQHNHRMPQTTMLKNGSVRVRIALVAGGRGPSGEGLPAGR